MIVRIWFCRDEDNRPLLKTEERLGSESAILTHLVSEELYDQWVPDTNYFPGESLSEGVEYDKPLIPNLKG